MTETASLILLRIQQMHKMKTNDSDSKTIPAIKTVFLSVKTLIAPSTALYELLSVIFLSRVGGSVNW